jgi:muconate cycloisomerase
MRIHRIDLYLNRQPFRVPFVSLHAERREASGVLLRMESDEGMVGWGESTPREYVSGETCEGVMTLIQKRFADLIFAAKIASLVQLQELLDALEARTQLPTPVAASSALGAVDLALWDLWGRACTQPVHRFFLPAPLPLPPLSLSVPILSPTILRRFYPQAAAMGIKRFKLVLSADTGENVARLTMLRDLAGAQADIAIDANGKLSPPQVLAMMPQLAPFGITALEQPAGQKDLQGLALIRNTTGLPVTLDESICTLADAQEAIELGICDTVNLKISKCGGLHTTSKIFRLASRHGIACQLGSHVGETPILAAAGCVAARTMPGLSFMEIGSSFLDPCSPLQPEGSVCANQGIGLGLSFTPDVVEDHFGPPVLTLSAAK